MVTWSHHQGNAVEWDAALSALNGNFYQSHAWGEYRATAGWSVRRLVGSEGGCIVALAQILVRRRAGVSIGWIPGGPAGAVSTWADGFAQMLRSELGRVAYVRMNLLRETATDDVTSLAQSGWRRPSVRMGSGLSMEVDLKPDMPARLASASSNWRHNLKRSSKYGLQIERWQSPDAAQMSAVYREMEGFKGLPEQHSQQALEQMQACLGDKLIVFRCLDAQGALLAFRAGAVFAGRGWDLLAAASGAARKVYASHALLWALLEACRAGGAEVFDMGGVDPEGNKGVFDFKQGTGARLVEYLGEWEWAGVPGLAGVAGIMLKRKGIAG